MITAPAIDTQVHSTVADVRPQDSSARQPFTWLYREYTGRQAENISADESAGTTKWIDTPSYDITAPKVAPIRSEVGSAASAMIFDGYVQALIDKLNEAKNLGFGTTISGSIISSSESYFRTLSANPDYRLFITGIMMCVRNNYQLMDATKVSLLLALIKRFKASSRSSGDYKNVRVGLRDIGIKPLKTATA